MIAILTRALHPLLFLQAALVHCNAGAVEKQNCCKALSAAVHSEKYCWSSLFGQIFVTDLFKCGVIPKC